MNSCVSGTARSAVLLSSLIDLVSCRAFDHRHQARLMQDDRFCKGGRLKTSVKKYNKVQNFTMENEIE